MVLKNNNHMSGSKCSITCTTQN